MNILRFKKPPEPQSPKAKAKRTPRLRIVKTDKDIRISKSDYESGLARFIAQLRKRVGYVDVVRDGHSAMIFTGETLRHMPKPAYMIRRKDGAILDIHGYKPCMRGKPIGNILNWS
jgi:hypothetical protein